MPETFREKISRVLRDFQGYTGDGQGGAGDLPIGDRSTAQKRIEKRDLREMFNDYADVADDAQAAAGSAADSAIEAALYDPTVRFKTPGDLIASDRSAKGDGAVWQAGSDLYEEVATGGDITNAATVPVKLKAQVRSGVLNVDALAPPRNGVTFDTATINAAVAALAREGGGTLNFSQLDYYLDGPVVIDPTITVPIHLKGNGSRLNLQAGATGIKLNQGRSEPPGASADGFNILGAMGAGTRALLIDDNSEAKAHNIKADRCETGLELTGSGHWSESSDLDHIVLKDCKTSVKLSKSGGTGSMGYAKWGLIHIAGMGTSWDDAIGFHVGEGVNFWNSDVSMMVIHCAPSPTARAMVVEGDLSRNVRIHSVLEGFGTAVGRIAIDLTSTGNVFGAKFDTFFLGNWDTLVRSNAAGQNGNFVINERGTQYRAEDDVPLLRAFNLGASEPKMELMPNELRFGDGVAATDVALRRSSDGNLQSRGLFEFLNASNRRTILDSAATGTRTVTFGNSSGRIPAVSTDGVASQDYGFNLMSGAAGAPSGVPADAPAGTYPFYFDATNKKIYVHDGTGWIATAALS
ncbi:hypothetical protein [Sulfitobacter sp. D7]|uniref:hypothetical protein n=1 Tax=Sulfitobacter sp. D7 TaxID=1968541 RepID=UPI000E779296|nr:hypothetical protein [Sulfitobacter sp. D7]AYE85103.1 hypothetical protein B5M07_02665 [Sulfitobacter sp. D7]